VELRRIKWVKHTASPICSSLSFLHNPKGQDMANYEHVAALRQYAEETHRRIGRTITHLLALQSQDGNGFADLLQHIQEQEIASRDAGYERVARLCQSMEDCLTGIHCGEEPRLEAVTTTLLEVCEAIRVHADVLGTMAADAHLQTQAVI
jgi:hypothetical protein